MDFRRQVQSLLLLSASAWKPSCKTEKSPCSPVLGSSFSSCFPLYQMKGESDDTARGAFSTAAGIRVKVFCRRILCGRLRIKHAAQLAGLLLLLLCVLFTWLQFPGPSGHGNLSPECEGNGSDWNTEWDMSSPGTEATLEACALIYPMSHSELEDAVPQLKSCVVTTYAKHFQRVMEQTTCRAKTLEDADIIWMPAYFGCNCNWPTYDGGRCESTGNAVRLGKKCVEEVLLGVDYILAEVWKTRSQKQPRVVILDDNGHEAPDCCNYFTIPPGLWQGQPCFNTHFLPAEHYARPELLWAFRGATWPLYRKGIDIALPSPPHDTASWPPASSPLKSRKYFATFKGKLLMHPIRVYTHRHFHNKTYEGKKVVIAERMTDEFVKGYGEVLHETVFSLLLRGDTHSTHRWNDVVCSGSVPVLVTDYMIPPYNELVPFESYGVFVRESHIDRLMDILQAVSQEEREAKRAASLRRPDELARLVQKIAELQGASQRERYGSGRGVVVVGGSNHHVSQHTHSYTFDALLCVASLRRTGSSLPVELWHQGDAHLLSAKLPEHVFLRDFRDVASENLEGYALPAVAMLHSSFEEFLYLDADNTVLVDPAPLFEISAYTTLGAVFWPDFPSFRRDSLIWQMTDQPYYPLQEVENGQLLIHRNRHLAKLELAYYFSMNKDFYFKITLGDKDLLMMAFLALSTPFHQVSTPTGAMGYTTASGAFCGHTMLQHHPLHEGLPVFAHRNLLKWSANLDLHTPSWTAVKRGSLDLVDLAMGWLLLILWSLGPRRSTALTPGKQPGHQQLAPGCKCDGAHYADENYCVDLDTDQDISAEASRLLETAATLEQELLRLREALRQGPTLRSEWWVTWASSVQAPSSSMASSSGASWLAAYLASCVESIPAEELEFDTLDNGGSEGWAEHPHSSSGRHIRCLAEHPELHRMALTFYGYPGPNGVFSAALGLRSKARAGADPAPAFTFEASEERCRRGLAYLEAEGMSKYIDLRCGILCESMTEAGCRRYLTGTVCPERLDFLSIDFALGVPPLIYRSLLTACRPRVLFAENSGLNLSSLPGQDDESHSNFSEHDPTSWHHWEDQLHQLSALGQPSELGSYRLAVDRQPSSLDAERPKGGFFGLFSKPQDSELRRFSLYVAEDSGIGEATTMRNGGLTGSEL
ncbi:MNN2 [Symbiodinium sp. CCMP2592]|nr:MNN2 [Symbiodinium sp. CCMP2592]